MSRLISTVRLDLRLQVRYGFYYAAAFVTLLWIALLYPLPPSVRQLATPLVVFAELAVIGYYFIAGMVLFEKGERTLSAIVTTPLRFEEYLGSKLATLTMMAIAASLILVLAAYGTGFDAALLVLGVILTSVISMLAGFISVLPFDQITRYLIPSQLPLTLISVPLIPFLDIWHNPIFYLFPTHGPLLLLGSAFDTNPLTTWQLLYAVIYGLLWVFVLAFVARKMFIRYVVSGGR
ncbi:multidrug ABC transporter permease [soil metagenome]|jgi:fluoroquinolone transport system permease protein